MTMQYKTGTDSSVGNQLRTDFYQKKALIEAAKEQYFGQLADTTAMPKNMGKTIKRFHYLPILDDANINDQGIDAAGAVITQEKTIIIIPAGLEDNIYTNDYAVGEGADASAATTAAQAKASALLTAKYGIAGADYAAKKAAAITAGLQVIDSNSAVPVSGNLYGSSKDIGYIASKFPVLSENGGRVNRVGVKRREIEGTISKFGFFDEYTQESLDFDTDEELEMHINREMVRAANEINEDMLQIDLLNSAGVIRLGGEAITTGELTGEDGAVPSEITYGDLQRLAIELNDNRCPKHTKIITGTRMIDTRVVDAARYMYIGSELEPLVRDMKDNFNNPAFIGVAHYAAGTTLAKGEIGQVGDFRVIVVPEMMHWAGAGATVTTNDGYRETNGKYDVFPMLVVGDESFTTIGFQTDGKTVKFKVKHAKPGSTESYANDPYGEKGFMSIKWYYGFMPLRPERIALCKTVAKW